jgi:CheY-like chemotaxis protein/anti-sigma regulatory factor (Ser/Thr protein kinase)
MLTVINDILDFSKIEAGKVALESIPFDVCEIVEDVAALCSPLAVAKGVELSCCFPVTIRSDVKGDPNRLRQVLANLIGNAAKFTPSGEVAVSVSQVDQDEHSVVLRFEVQDTGIGMSVASRARIFDSFGQADSSTTREFGGTGLGLTIARQLVTLMGGSIELSSDEGEGTTFAVRLRMELQSGPGDALALLPTVAGVRALTVDESRTSALAVSGYLRDWGLDVHVVTDSHRAIDVLRAAARNGEPFRVALLSRAISSNDVWSLASSIRADPLLSGTRLVLVTSDGSDHPTGGDSPFDFTLSKPVRRAMLRNIVSAMLEPHTVIAPSRPVSAPQPGKLEGLVLLVEDNVVNQRLAVGMLTRLGLEVAVANDGQEALDMLWEREYDLVLMDCQMPVLDGFEATRELRRREGSGRRTPIIALTAGAMAGNEDDCRAAGMDGYLTKPYRLRELHSAVESWLVPVDD